MFRKGKHRRPTPAGRRISRRGVALGLALSLMTAGIAYADQLYVDDGDTVFAQTDSIALGGLCPNTSTSFTATFKIRRNGGNNVTFAGPSVTITAGTPTSSSITRSMGTDNSVTLLGEWSGQDANTLTDDTATATITVSTGASLGSFSGSVPFTATGPNSTTPSGTHSSTATQTVTWSVVTCDSEPPVAAPTVTPAPNGAGWNNTDVTVNWNWSDNVALGSPCTTSTSVTTEGVHNLTATCKDTAGNTGSASVTVRVDKTAPTISAALDKTPDAVSGWFNISTGAPTVQFACGDAGGSGLAGACPANILVGEGAGLFGSGQSFTGGPISDVAGNTSTQASIGGIKVDLTAPTITADIVPGIPGSGWYMASPTVSFDCQDTGSSVVASTCPASIPVGEGTGQSFSGGPIYDNAGNASSTDGVSGINVDLTPPTIEANLDRAAGASGWFNSTTGAPNVQFTCDDLGGSGLVGPCPADAPVGEGENQSVSGGPVYDLAGHSSGIATINDIDVDLTAPVVTPSGPTAGPYVMGSVPVLSCSTSDAGGSGVASPSTPTAPSGPASGVGLFTATCSAATDVAGNTGAAVSVTYRVVYAFAGFYRPIENGVKNVVKAGSAVPVKFSLGGYQGMSVLDGAPISQTSTSCNAADPSAGEVITETSGNSGLSYDASTDTYNYVWKTNKAWTGCRVLTVKFADGTMQTALFEFKK